MTKWRGKEEREARRLDERERVRREIATRYGQVAVGATGRIVRVPVPRRQPRAASGPHSLAWVLSMVSVDDARFLAGPDGDDGPGFVYFVRLRDAIKVGMTTRPDPMQRVRGVSRNIPEPVQPVGAMRCKRARHAEWAVHQHLSGERMWKKEWFALSSRLLRLIEELSGRSEWTWFEGGQDAIGYAKLARLNTATTHACDIAP